MSLSRKKIKQMGAVALLVILMFIMGCFFIKDDKVKTLEKNDYGKTLEKNDYGVFLNADASSLERFKKYDLIVIDAQYFTKKDIESLHQNGTKVYTYLNIGSVENFREYYKTYEKFTIGKYEHWDEEKWVDVSVPAWQKFIEQLSKKLFEKGVDGFFIDNCDVYYYAPRKSIFEGLTAILQNIMTLKKAVIINGGDTYVTKYRERYGAVDHIMTGVNQESVWSGIDFDKGTFNEQTRETREYYSKYLEACKADGMEVYLLEYTTDEKLIQKIKKYCKEKNFHFYISNSLELQ
ncbi:MAG: endo alpha-1,4 polygalactosaminidase [Lachnospiraceae bacterium]|nr:endo alpha-1,4 polygalactosaminidase [Lachnospiraceae bacterium]